MTRELSTSDITGIHQTLALFAHAVDNKETDALSLVFTDDVTIEIGVGKGTVLHGLDAFRDYVRRLPADAADHQTVDTIILVDSDGTVRARSRYLAVRADGSITNGDYLDIVTRTPRGWRINYRRTVHRYPRVDGLIGPTAITDEWRPEPARAPLTIQQD